MEDRIFFCRKPFCKNHLTSDSICPEDGESSVTAGEKLNIDTKAIERVIKTQTELLDKHSEGWVCFQCDFWANTEGKCPAGHKLKTKKEEYDDLRKWYNDNIVETERNIGLPTAMPLQKKLPKKLSENIVAIRTYVSDLMRKALEKIDIRDAVIINEWQEKAQALEPEEFLKEAKKYRTPKDIAPNLLAIENYIEATKIERLTATASVKYDIGDEVVNAFLPEFMELKKEEKTFTTIATDLNLSYEQIKRTLRLILPEYFNSDVNANPSELLVPFVISKEKSMSGQVLSNLDGAKKSITLITVYSEGGLFHYQFFGEGRPSECKKIPVFIRYNELFYVYKFQSDTTEEIILLSSKELELSGCKIYGMEANCYDFLKIGNMAKISTTQKIFFVHSQKPSIDKITEDIFWEKADKYSKECVYEKMFGKYPHPDWFAAFICAWAFSGKLSDMPTHLSLMSPPALGKTKMLENLGKTFKQSLNDGGTIKGLVPSFANGVPREGYLIKCRRFSFVDEFLHIIQSSIRSGGDFDGGSFQLLKVLEHSEGEHSSAFGVIKAKPKMWVIFCSNIRPYEHIKNLVDLHEKLNVAFMSRILWYVYDKDHIDFINSHKSEVMTFKGGQQPVHDTTFVSLVDYMHSITIDIPIKVIENIHAKYRPYVPAPLELDIYDSRMIMHIYRIMDGYIKYKSLIEKRGKFICTAEDVQECDEIIGRIIRSWSQNIDEQHMTPAMKLAYLDATHREIFDFIKINQTTSVGGGVDENMLRNLKGITAVDIADDLVPKHILKVIPNPSGIRIFYTYDAYM